MSGGVVHGPISEQARKCNQCVEECVEFNLMEYDEERVWKAVERCNGN